PGSAGAHRRYAATTSGPPPLQREHVAEHLPAVGARGRLEGELGGRHSHDRRPRARPGRAWVGADARAYRRGGRGPPPPGGRLPAAARRARQRRRLASRAATALPGSRAREATAGPRLRAVSVESAPTTSWSSSPKGYMAVASYQARR